MFCEIKNLAGTTLFLVRRYFKLVDKLGCALHIPCQAQLSFVQLCADCRNKFFMSTLIRMINCKRRLRAATRVFLLSGYTMQSLRFPIKQELICWEIQIGIFNLLSQTTYSRFHLLRPWGCFFSCQTSLVRILPQTYITLLLENSLMHKKRAMTMARVDRKLLRNETAVLFRIQ